MFHSKITSMFYSEVKNWSHTFSVGLLVFCKVGTWIYMSWVWWATCAIVTFGLCFFKTSLMNYCLVDCLNVTPVQSFLGFLFYLHYVCLCSERLKLSLDYANTLKLQIVAPFCTIIMTSFQDNPRTQQNCRKRACFTMSVQKEDIYSRVTRMKYTLRMYRSDAF